MNDDLTEQLLIEPNIDAIRPKIPAAPDFSKQIGRPEKRHIDDDQLYIIDLPDNPIPFDPSQPRVKGIPDLSKQQDRFDNRKEMAKDMDFEQEEVIIENVDMPKKIKGFVQLDR